MKGAQGLDPAGLIGDALRILQRLAAPGTRLVRRTDVYVLIGTHRAGRALHVPVVTVEALRRREWLAPAADSAAARDAFVLSEVGLDWLKRTLAGDDPFHAQHRMLTYTETTRDDGTAAIVAVNEMESPIARLRSERDAESKPRIDETQFLAGERLRRDFTLANLEPRLAVDLTAPVVAGRRSAHHDEISDIAVAARQRVSRALVALGPHLADVAIDVCCHLKEPDAAESMRGWSDNAGLVVLKIVLDRLAAHYGFVGMGRGSRTRAWRAPDDESSGGSAGTQ